MTGIDRIKFKYYFFGTLTPRLISFSFLPILSFFLSKNELGEYDLFLSSLSLLIPIITLQIEEAYYRWHFEAPSNLLKTVIYFTFFTHLILLVVAGLMSYYHLVPLNARLLLATFSSSFLLLFQFIARSNDRIVYYAWSGFINSIGILIFSFLFYYFQDINIDSIAIAYILSNFATLFFISYKLKIYRILFVENFDYKLIKRLLKFSIPLMPNTISWWMVNLANRYIITKSLGLGFTASYAVAARVPSLLVLLNSIFLLFMQDSVFKSASEKKNETNFAIIFKNYCQIQITIAITLMCFSKQIVRVLFPNIYSDSYKLAPLIVFGVMLTNTCAFLGVFFLGNKKTNIIFLSTILGAILNLVFTQCTIVNIGLYAPALGTIFGFSLICIIRIFYLNKYYIVRVDMKPIIGLVSVYILASLLIFLDNIYIEVLAMITSILFFYFINRRLIQQFAKPLLNVI